MLRVVEKDESKNLPFGWKPSSTYTIKVVEDSGFVSEADYSTGTSHA